MDSKVRAVTAAQSTALYDLWRRMVRLDKDFHDTGLGPRQEKFGVGVAKTPSIHDFVQAATNSEQALHRDAEYSTAKTALDNIRKAYNDKVLAESRGQGQAPGFDRWEKTRANIRTKFAKDPQRAEALVDKLDDCLNDVRDAISAAGVAMTKDPQYMVEKSKLSKPGAMGYVEWNYIPNHDWK